MNVCTRNSISQGKCTYPPTKPKTWSANVFAEGYNLVRLGDLWEEHCKGDCHTPTQVKASSSVFVNGRPLARVNDDLDCGDKVGTGAGTVFAG